jgi:hypothetical protein
MRLTTVVYLFQLIQVFRGESLISRGLKNIYYSLLGPWQLAIEIIDDGCKSKFKLDHSIVIRFAKNVN